MSSTALLPVAGALVLVLILTLVVLRSKKLERLRAGEVMRKFSGRELLGFTSNANFMGRKSAGMAQLRGNGVLLLAADELYFEMWKPARSVSIPISSIQRVSKVRVFLGKTKGVQMLQVDFTNKEGNPDACAFIVRNLETWLKALTKISRQKAQ